MRRRIDKANPSLVMSVLEAADFTGFSRSQIYRWLSDGTLVAKKVGRATKIQTKDLIALVDRLPPMGA